MLHREEYAYSGDDLVAVERTYQNATLVNEVRFVRDSMLVAQERNAANAVTREYPWGLNLGGGIGGLLELRQGGQNYAYLYDGKGNVEAVLDASQSVVAGYRYDPFGILLNQTGSLTQPYGFSTKRYDAAIGMIQYEYRNYFPAIGRWGTRDPLGEAGGMNLYAFVGNNPVNWVDPWGLAKPGDVAFFNWKGADHPRHATIVTQVDDQGNATHALGAWRSPMTFRVVDLRTYNGGITGNIIGYGDMTGLNALELEDFINAWTGKEVAPDFDGYQGLVCIDAVTDPDGYGGDTLRDAMRALFSENPNNYTPIPGDPMQPDPDNPWFYRKNPWLWQFFKKTNRYDNRYTGK